jgi:hypothetical protein
LLVGEFGSSALFENPAQALADVGDAAAFLNEHVGEPEQGLAVIGLLLEVYTVAIPLRTPTVAAFRPSEFAYPSEIEPGRRFMFYLTARSSKTRDCQRRAQNTASTSIMCS